MRDKFKIKSVYTMLMVILMGFVLVESNYWYLLSILVCSSDTRYVIWGTLIILTVIAQKLKIRKTYIFVPWLFYIAMILFRNQEFAHGRYSNTERLILCITMVFVCAYKSDWVKKIPKMIVAIGIPNVIATLVFLVNDSLYKVFISRTYGEYQSGTEYGKDKQQDIAMRVIADHIRTIAFSITDGQLPSNAKAGYVIRRILRRAVRYGYTFLGQKQAFMYKLLPVLIDNMGEAYPELVAQKTLIEKVIKEEEESFLRTLETGIRLLDKTMEDTKANGKTEISGKDAFTLYDTFGFPLDLTELILRENGMTVNIEEFNEEMQQQKQRARNAAAIETGDWIVLKEGTTEFVGYDYTEYEASILRYRQIKQKNQTLYQIVLDYTPFYAESGGQVGDTGVLVSEFETIEVVDTKKENNLPIHITKKLPEHPEAPMMACVDTDKRAACAANHSATHLLDAALREVLGEHIEQKGSLVTPDSLRFDFSHFQKVTDEEIRKVEHIVNARIRANIPLKEYRNIPIEEAKELGAIALFGEKYGDRVRVIQFGTSIEFCGGTHVAATGNIGMVKIISESSVAAGVRRIEAYTGARVEEMLDTIQDTLSDLKALFNNAPDLRIAIRKYLDENAGLKKQVEDFMKEKEAALKERLLKNVQEIHGIKVIKFCAPLPAEVVKNIAFQLRGEITENLFFVAGSTDNGKPMLTVMLSDNLVAGGLKAGNLVKEAAKLIQGGGGGQPHFATAGGKNADGLPAAVEKVLELAGI